MWDGEKREIRVEETDLEDGRQLKNIQCTYRRRNGQDQSKMED